jgi:DNA topoisomerase III
VDLDALSSDERRIFDLVARRFLGAFHPDAEIAHTEVIVRVGEPDGAVPAPGTSIAEDLFMAALPAPPDRFQARGRVCMVAGWQAVAGFDDEKGGARARDKAKEPVGDDQARLPPLSEGQRLDGRFEVLDRQTRPPPRHTEATLLGAMESAGREIEDEALRAAMKDTGLGTPATRASTIETLLKRKFIAREGKMVVATPTGIELIERLPVPTLASPELTGAWEARLARISRGQEARAAFMADIARYVREMTDTIRGARPAGKPPAAAPAAPAKAAKPTAPAPTTTALPCPLCKQGTLMTGRRGWGCTRWREGCPFVIWFEIAGRRLTAAQLRDLVEKGKTRKSNWAPSGDAHVVAGRLVLDLAAPPDGGGSARFQAS